MLTLSSGPCRSSHHVPLRDGSRNSNYIYQGLVATAICHTVATALLRSGRSETGNAQHDRGPTGTDLGQDKHDLTGGDRQCQPQSSAARLKYRWVTSIGPRHRLGRRPVRPGAKLSRNAGTAGDSPHAVGRGTVGTRTARWIGCLSEKIPVRDNIGAANRPLVLQSHSKFPFTTGNY